MSKSGSGGGSRGGSGSGGGGAKAPTGGGGEKGVGKTPNLPSRTDKPSGVRRGNALPK